jgi:hypothetical protein
MTKGMPGHRSDFGTLEPALETTFTSTIAAAGTLGTNTYCTNVVMLCAGNAYVIWPLLTLTGPS